MARPPKKLFCKMPGCGGVLEKNTFPMRTGCHSFSPCRACSKCGRVHSYDGHLMFNRQGAAVYLRHNIELIMEPVSFEQGKTYTNTGYLYVTLEGKEKDGIPEMVDLGPNTPLTFDGQDADEMFRFHDECGINYLLHRGDVNCIEEA
jgi:hypothetical protein